MNADPAIAGAIAEATRHRDTGVGEQAFRKGIEEERTLPAKCRAGNKI